MDQYSYGLGTEHFTATHGDEPPHDAGSSTRYLQNALAAWRTNPSPQNWMGLLSEFYGAYVAVPVNSQGQLVMYIHEGQLAIPAHTRREAVHEWCAALGIQERPQIRMMLGDDLVSVIASIRPDHCIMLDPQEAAVAIYAVDEYVAGYSRFAQLKAALRSNDVQRGFLDRIVQELMRPGAQIVYMMSPGSNQQHYPQLVNRPTDGAVACPLFTSALEVFRFQPQAGAGQTSVEWFRRYLPANVPICIDLAAEGHVVEISPQQLSAAGFWM